MDPGERIKTRALSLGFDAAGIAAVGPLEAREHYEAWLAAGRHGEMRWIASPSGRERRADIGRLMPGVRSVLCVGLCHDPGRDAERDRRLGRIARYAEGEDFHRVMRDMLRALERFVREEALPGSRTLWYVDTGAILERGWAARAGIGWVGKHAGLLSQRIGSWFLLGELLLDAALEPNAPVEERCGTCTACLDACPTGAIVAPYQVDARRCISYLTIERRGPIPRELRPLVGDWIFGCDVCQEVCPWNRFAPPAREARLHARSLDGWSLERLLAIDEGTFARLFADSPIRRAGREGLARNACVALGNREEAAAVPALARALRWDVSPIVRGHAAWALGEIARRAAPGGDAATAIREALARAAERDPAPEVREEAGHARSQRC
jgi:epoxyqueuosine reductase